MSGDPRPKLELRDLVRRFDGRAVVDHLSLTVQKGQVTCLLGPSGCGKSTTLRMIAGVEQPDGGEIFVDGERVSGGGASVPPEKRQIGLMFQDFALFPHLKVAENVAFGLKGRGATNQARVAELLDRVGLAQFENAYPHELSGGEQQRVALARALAPKPSIMLMDEPFSGLDNRLRDAVRDRTLDVLRAEDTAVLLVTHEPEEAMRMADQIVLMREGRMVQSGAPYELYTEPADPKTVAFFSDVNILQGSVSNGRVDTPFGGFAADGLEEGQHAEVIIRPQYVRVDFDRNGHPPAPTDQLGQAVSFSVTRARFVGGLSHVDMSCPEDGRAFKMSVPNVFLPPEGTRLWVMLPRDRCFVFPVG